MHIELIKDSEPSKWQIVKAMVGKMHADGTLWKNVILIVAIVASSVFSLFVVKITKKMILDSHKRLAEGNWRVYTYSKLLKNIISSRPFSKRDVIDTYVIFLICLPIIAAPFCLIFELAGNLRRTYNAVIEDFE